MDTSTTNHSDLVAENNRLSAENNRLKDKIRQLEREIRELESEIDGWTPHKKFQKKERFEE